MQRKTVTRAELDEWLTQEIQKIEDCEDRVCRRNTCWPSRTQKVATGLARQFVSVRNRRPTSYS